MLQKKAMNYLVMKFGGTSVGSAKRMQALLPLIADERPKIVVLSAMAGTTNMLVEIAAALHAADHISAKNKIRLLAENYQNQLQQLYKTAQKKEEAQALIISHFDFLESFCMDIFTNHEERAILAQGELLSTALFQLYLEEQGIASSLLPALEFMRLNADGEPDLQLIETRLRNLLQAQPSQNLWITQGYICRNAFGEIDNLKRGGSDYTATIIGSVLQSPEIQIWTDIDGMHNNDPRFVQPTFPVESLAYDEAAELAYFGARILHPTCVLPARKAKVPVRLLNTMQPSARGTLISEKGNGRPFTAVAAKDGITAINIQSGRMLLAYGFLRAVFEVFERYRTPIDMITTSEVAVSVTIDDARFLTQIVEELQRFGQVQVDQHQTIVCVVGDFSRNKNDQAFKVLEALREVPLRMVSYGGSDHNISVLVNSDDKKQALELLNSALFSHPLNVQPNA